MFKSGPAGALDDGLGALFAGGALGGCGVTAEGATGGMAETPGDVLISSAMVVWGDVLWFIGAGEPLVKK